MSRSTSALPEGNHGIPPDSAEHALVQQNTFNQAAQALPKTAGLPEALWPIERQQRELLYRHGVDFRRTGTKHRHQQWSKRVTRAHRDGQMRGLFGRSSGTQTCDAAFFRNQRKRNKAKPIITHSSRFSGLDSGYETKGLAGSQPDDWLHQRLARHWRRLPPVDREHERAKAVIQFAKQNRDSPGGASFAAPAYYIVGKMDNTKLFDGGMTIDAVHQAEHERGLARNGMLKQALEENARLYEEHFNNAHQVQEAQMELAQLDEDSEEHQVKYIEARAQMKQEEDELQQAIEQLQAQIEEEEAAEAGAAEAPQEPRLDNSAEDLKGKLEAIRVGSVGSETTPSSEP